MAIEETISEEKTIKLEFFAQFREDRGIGSEAVRTASATPAELYAELDARYHFRANRATTRIAVNDELAEWTRRLADGDTVVFLTPFGGG